MKENRKYQHVFFDLDRTIWDFDKNSRETIREIFFKYKLDRIIEEFSIFESTYRKFNKQLWADYRLGRIKKDELRAKRFFLTLQEFGITDAKLASDFDSDYVSQSPLKKTLFPSAIDVLTYLRKKYDLYILTNGFKETQALKMSVSGLTSFFSMVITSEEAGVLKPDPVFFQFALHKIQAEAYECLMIGDDPEVDIQGAKNAGIDQVWFNPDQLENSIKPTYEISQLNSLKEII